MNSIISECSVEASPSLTPDVAAGSMFRRRGLSALRGAGQEERSVPAFLALTSLYKENL